MNRRIVEYFSNWPYISSRSHFLPSNRFKGKIRPLSELLKYNKTKAANINYAKIEILHGGDSIIEKPLVSKGRINTDFGQAFYGTTSLAQAIEQAKKTSARHGYHTNPIVSQYIFDDDVIRKYGFRGHNFGYVPTCDWLDYLVANRKQAPGEQSEQWHEFVRNHRLEWLFYPPLHYVVGPVGDGHKMTKTINNYFNGVIQNPHDAIELLKAHNLQNQYAFKSQELLKHLKYNGYIKLPIPNLRDKSKR